MKPLFPLLLAGTLLFAAACENQEENAYRTEVGAILDKPFAALLDQKAIETDAFAAAKKMPLKDQQPYIDKTLIPVMQKTADAFIEADLKLHALGAPHSVGADHGTLVTQVRKLASFYKGESAPASQSEISQIFRAIGEVVVKHKVTSPALRRINAGEASK